MKSKERLLTIYISLVTGGNINLISPQSELLADEFCTTLKAKGKISAETKGEQLSFGSDARRKQ